MNMTRNKKTIGLMLGIMCALTSVSSHAEVQQEQVLAVDLHPASLTSAIGQIENLLRNFFWGPDNWATTVDRLLAVFNQHKDVIAAKIGDAKAVALAAALASVKHPGTGKAGLLKVQSVLTEFEHELLALASGVYNQVKAMSQLQLYAKVGRKVSAA